MTSIADGVSERGASDRRRANQLRRRLLRLSLMIVLPLIIVLAGGWWYLTSGRYASTDDAYVQSDMGMVSADVGGRVTEVAVHDNQRVTRGQLLFKLDDRPYRIAVERAKAQLAGAKLQVDGLRATYRQKLSDLKAAQDTMAYQQREFDRQQQLAASHVVSQAALDQARNTLDNARQQVSSTQQQIANVLSSLGGDPNIETDQHPLVQQMQAQLDQAQLDLSHTTVLAPLDGMVTKVDKLPIGNYLNAASPAFALIAVDHVWVEANFKETDLTHMRDGQPATVTVDAYPGTEFHAHVGSISPGTGSEFSVLPPQNATGNWVKVVQRLPVRIAIDDPDRDKPLRAGMSVTVDVDTGYVHPFVARVQRFFGMSAQAG